MRSNSCNWVKRQGFRGYILRKPRLSFIPHPIEIPDEVQVWDARYND